MRSGVERVMDRPAVIVARMPEEPYEPVGPERPESERLLWR